MIGKRKISMPLRAKILLTMSLFLLLVLGLLWLFQGVLFGRIFEEVRVTEGRYVADKMEKALKNGGFSAMEQAADDYAPQRTACVSVYRIVNTVSKKVTDLHTNDNCRIHDIANLSDLLHSLYIAAENGGGSAVQRFEAPVWGNQFHGSHPSDTAFCVTIVPAEPGTEYLIVVNVEVYPSAATVATLRRQLVFISVAITLLAAGVALWISARVSRPIVRLNRGAKELARGNYGADFSAPGYRETEELGETLAYAADELSKTEALRRELIANVSHDLRTPLTMIGGYAEIMRDIPGEITQENLQIIVDETRHLSALVNDLLDVSRLLSGAEAMRPEPMDLSKTVKDVHSHFEALLAPKGYTVTAHIAPGATVVGDGKRLRQAIYNLVGNAVNYTGEDKRVEIRLELMDGRVRFAVSDTGAGIAQEDLPRIWDRYYKVDKVHRREAVGTGLGLSIVKSVLDAHGAKFGVSSEPGHGSCFWFELPLA